MDLRRFESEPRPREYRGFCARNRVFNRHAAGVGAAVCVGQEPTVDAVADFVTF